MSDVFDQTNTPVPTDKPATPEYRPLPTAEDLAERPKKKEYSSDLEGVEKAAKDLTKAREEGRVPQAEAEAEPVDRGYRWQGGRGDPVESEYTIEARRAAEDLVRVRQGEAAAANPTDTGRMTAAVDAMRQAYGRELPPDFLTNLQQHAEAAQRQQQQPQPEQFQAQQTDQQATQQQQQDPADAVRQVLENNPAVRQALEAELQQTEQARAAYAQQARAAAQISAASLLASYPELAHVPTDQLQTAISSIAQVNPQRAAQINAHLERTQTLYNAFQSAESQRATIQQQQLQQWIASQDAEFDRQVTSKETPESMRKITEDVVALAGEYGIGKQELAALWQSQPLMRAAPFQRMMVDAAKYRAAQREVVTKLDRSAPPVQRPGVSQPRTDDSQAAMAKFKVDPNPKSAAALLMARRAATSRR
jgi:hypothetical protein